MEFSTVDTAVVFIGPQVDVLSPDGKNWVFKDGRMMTFQAGQCAGRGGGGGEGPAGSGGGGGA